MIITILELQNQGKLQECSQCAPCALVMLRRNSAHAAAARRLQARLQQNLMYLAAIADKTAGASAAAAAR